METAQKRRVPGTPVTPHDAKVARDQPLVHTLETPVPPLPGSATSSDTPVAMSALRDHFDEELSVVIGDVHDLKK